MKLILFLAVVLVLHAEVIPFDSSAVEKIFQQKQAALFLFVGDENSEVAAIDALNAYDATNPSIVLSLSSKNDGHGLFERLAEYLGVNLENTPQVLYFSSEAQKYKLEGDITAEALANFVERVERREVEQFLKSAPVPESNDEPVKVVVGKTFKELVLDSPK